ncbi:MAG: hypothetical protein LUH10_00490 [Tannerellaceae bacterium]|nr:hypothetical protein [Tannerellaceae bacterium]
MGYKHNCGCGSHNHFVDLSCTHTQPLEDAQALLGLNHCGKIIPVQKPEPELSEADREKLDTVDVNGNGSSALFNDGNYKETYTKEQTGEAIESSKKELTDYVDEQVAGIHETLEDAVFYTDENDIEVREDIILKRNNEIRAKHPDGAEYTLLQTTSIGITNYGDSSQLTNLVSSTRPVAQLSGETVTDVHPIAFVEDVTAVAEDLDAFREATEKNFTDVNREIDMLSDDVLNDLAELTVRVDHTEGEVANLQASVTEEFSTVHSSLGDLDSRVATNENNITVNKSDIAALRDTIAAQDKFKGYYKTTAEILLIPGESGAYAWSAESGSVWVYDGNSWVNSGDAIPDQTVDAYDGHPLMDGEAGAGSSNEYARGDHRHPTDTTRAAIADLDNYLSLAGNGPDTCMTGDIWLTSGKAVRTSDNSYIAQEADLQQMQIVAGGIGGVDIQTANGTAKYNNIEIATVKDVADVSYDLENLESTVAEIDSRVVENENNITINKSDIAALRDNLNAQEKFKGYYKSNAEVGRIPGESGAYAWSAESGTVWVYDGNSWVNSGDAIPDQTVDAYDGSPLMDGDAGAGSSNEYARGDHRHPTDTTRAAVADLDNYLPLAGNDAATRMTGDIWLSSGNAIHTSENGNSYIAQDPDLQQMQIVAEGIGGVDIQTANGTAKYNNIEIATVRDVANVSSGLTGLESTVTGIESRVSENEIDIIFLQEAIEAAEHFRGYFAKTAEVTALIGEKGDYAWNGQTGTVWLYNGNSWVDSENPIPAETPYDELPEMDGQAYSGDVTEFARGNHVHPTDTSRASASALSALEGTVSGQDSRLSDAEGNINTLQTTVSGNATAISVLQNSVTTQEERMSIAEGNISTLQSDVSSNVSDIAVLQSTVSEQGNRLATAEGQIVTIVSDLSSAQTKLDDYIVSNDARVTPLEEKVYDLQGRTSSHETALSTLQSTVSTATGNITALDSRVSANEVNIAGNASDIQGILNTLAAQEKFRGYYKLTTDVTAIKNPDTGDYAWNGETNTVWIYNGITWTDSGTDLPDVIVTASDATPLIDGVADAGASREYARGDHRHPVDTSRASAADLTVLQNLVSDLSEDTTALREDVDENTSGVSVNTADIATLKDRVTAAEEDIIQLEAKINADIESVDGQIEEVINDLKGTAESLKTLSESHEQLVGLHQALDTEVKENYYTKAEAAVLENTVSNLADDVSKLRTDVDNNTTGVSINSADIAELKGLMTLLGEGFEELEENVNRDIESMQAEARETIQSLKDEVKDNYYTKAEADQKYDALLARIEALETILSGVSGFWSGSEEEYSTVDPKDPDTYYHTYE